MRQHRIRSIDLKNTFDLMGLGKLIERDNAKLAPMVNGANAMSGQNAYATSRECANATPN